MSLEIAGTGFIPTESKIDRKKAGNDAYRKLVVEAIAIQQKMAADISALRERVTAIDKLLREVE
ncbi:MAG TPA: hypothetical protein DD791_04795 [Syntrophomonas sp.]|jgi:hypothetical protein|nr:hypothetical protein [Syntrophomonas sp.]